MSKVVAICSGGLDSTTMVWDLFENGHTVQMVGFHYGQRHEKELKYAEKTAERLKLRFDVIDLRNLSVFLAESGSSLVSGTDVPEGHYAEENMKATVVPNRNMIMLSIAGGIAVATDAEHVFTGVHAGDHFIYPDCRPEFIDLVSRAMNVGNTGFGNFGDLAILAPFLHMSKADIALTALELGVPLHETWSCYKGGDVHCGRCGTCVERLEAIHQAQERFETIYDHTSPEDKTEYADTEFWKEKVREAPTEPAADRGE
jgi:7-cyano-7-deazaguanine synthase